MFIWGGEASFKKFHGSLNVAYNGVIHAERASAVMCFGNYAPTKQTTPYNHDLTIMFVSLSANPK